MTNSIDWLDAEEEIPVPHCYHLLFRPLKVGREKFVVAYRTYAQTGRTIWKGSDGEEIHEHTVSHWAVLAGPETK